MQKLGICDIWETNEAQSEGKFFIDVYKIDAQEKIIKEIENISKDFNFLSPMQVLEIEYNKKRFVWKSYIYGDEEIIINLADKERDEEDAVELAIPKGIKVLTEEKIIKEIENISKGFNFLNPMQVLEIKYNRKRFVWKSYIFGNEQVIINLTDKERDEEDAVELAIPKGIKVLTEEEIAREAKIDKLLSYLVFFLLFVLTIIYFWYYFQP
jgi:hypothetical protein